MIEHRQFRPIFSGTLVVSIVAVAVFPNATMVFGQMASPADLVKADVVVTEEAIMTTKTTSRFPVVGRLSQRFSYYHPGIDIEQPFNSPINPFLPGVVFETGFHTGGYGNYVLIDHQNGYFSLYAHLNNIFAKKSDPVTQDSVIGTVGLTGRTTGSHLHFEVYENGRAINPLTILPETKLASATVQTAQAEPTVHPTQTLTLPLSQPENPSAEQRAPATGGALPQLEEEKVQKPASTGIWLPDSLKQSTAQPLQLPTLVKL